MRFCLPGGSISDMAYTNAFHRLVLSGSLYSETFSTTLAVARAEDMSPVDNVLLGQLWPIVGTWFGSVGTNGPQFTSNCRLLEFKVNRIDVDGHYADPLSFTHDYGSGVVGGSAFSVAPQLTPVATLNTGVTRGLAHKGRMYLPPALGYYIPGTDGRADVVDAQRISRAVSTLINSINGAYSTWGGGGDFNGRVSVVSAVRTGAWHLVTSVETGRVIDTMRSRRSSLDENYQPSSVAIAGA